MTDEEFQDKMTLYFSMFLEAWRNEDINTMELMTKKQKKLLNEYILSD